MFALTRRKSEYPMRILKKNSIALKMFTASTALSVFASAAMAQEANWGSQILGAFRDGCSLNQSQYFRDSLQSAQDAISVLRNIDNANRENGTACNNALTTLRGTLPSAQGVGAGGSADAIVTPGVDAQNSTPGILVGAGQVSQTYQRTIEDRNREIEELRQEITAEQAEDTAAGHTSTPNPNISVMQARIASLQDDIRQTTIRNDRVVFDQRQATIRSLSTIVDNIGIAANSCRNSPAALTSLIRPAAEITGALVGLAGPAAIAMGVVGSIVSTIATALAAALTVNHEAVAMRAMDEALYPAAIRCASQVMTNRFCESSAAMFAGIANPQVRAPYCYNGSSFEGFEIVSQSDEIASALLGLTNNLNNERGSINADEALAMLDRFANYGSHVEQEMLRQMRAHPNQRLTIGDTLGRLQERLNRLRAAATAVRTYSEGTDFTPAARARLRTALEAAYPIGLRSGSGSGNGNGPNNPNNVDPQQQGSGYSNGGVNLPILGGAGGTGNGLQNGPNGQSVQNGMSFGNGAPNSQMPPQYGSSGMNSGRPNSNPSITSDMVDMVELHRSFLAHGFAAAHDAPGLRLLSDWSVRIAARSTIGVNAEALRLAVNQNQLVLRSFGEYLQTRFLDALRRADRNHQAAARAGDQSTLYSAGQAIHTLCGSALSIYSGNVPSEVSSLCNDSYYDGSNFPALASRPWHERRCIMYRLDRIDALLGRTRMVAGAVNRNINPNGMNSSGSGSNYGSGIGSGSGSSFGSNGLQGGQGGLNGGINGGITGGINNGTPPPVFPDPSGSTGPKPGTNSN